MGRKPRDEFFTEDYRKQAHDLVDYIFNNKVTFILSARDPSGGYMLVLLGDRRLHRAIINKLREEIEQCKSQTLND